MAKSIQDFANDYAKRAQLIGEKISLDLFTQIVKGTPVDEGTAKGNWQVTTTQPATGTLDRKDKTGDRVITEETPRLKKGMGSIIYITNNLPYIYRLEFLGWSKQARSGWVRAAIQRAKNSG